MEVTNTDLVVLNGGGSVTHGDKIHASPGTGHQSHYPIWKDSDGIEYIYVDGFTPVRLDRLVFPSSRRETVVRK